MKKFANLSLKKKILSILALSLSAILLLFAIIIKFEFDNLADEYRNELTNTGSEVYIKKYDDLKRHLINSIKLAAINPIYSRTFKKNDPAAVKSFLNVFKRYFDVDFLVATDREGNVVARSISEERGDNIFNYYGVKAALQNKEISAYIYKDKGVSVSIMAFSPFFDEDNSILGCIILGYELTNLERLDLLKKMTSCEFAVVENDKLLAHTFSENESKNLASVLIGRNEEKFDSLSFSKINLSSNNYYLLKRKIKEDKFESEVYLLVAKNIDKEIKQAYFLLFKLAGILIFIGFFAFLIVYYSSEKYIIKPTSKLLNAIRSFSKGQISRRVKVKYEDEIGQIGKSLNEFSENIQHNFVNALNKLTAGESEVDIRPLGDNDELTPALETLRNHLNELIAQTKKLIEASESGQLQLRANSQKLTGKYKDIVDGFNATLERLLTPIYESIETFKKIGEGNLKARISSNYQGDYKLIKENINNAVELLERAIKELKDGVFVAASATAEITASLEELTAAAKEQSMRISEISASIDQMSKTIADSAKNSNLAAKSSLDSAKKAQAGGDIINDIIQKIEFVNISVKDAYQKLDKLAQTAVAINEIATVINDIADQTNLLALNAAIEAARAGEQGRGFAVVADEVRKLAERTSKGAKEIETMIKQIQIETAQAVDSMKVGFEEVNNSKTLVDKAGTALKEIIDSSNFVNDLINQLAAAAEQQSASADEIKENVATIDKISIETTEGLNQISKSIDDLNRLTEKLRSLSERFIV